MPSLHERQRRFVEAVLGDAGAAAPFPADRIAIYRRNGRSNYRNALSATYPVVKRLVGEPFFNAAVDHYLPAHPSRSGDLNVHGDAFGDFLASYPPAAPLPYLPDVARLEWALDEAQRAADAPRLPEAALAAFAIVPAERLPLLRLCLDPSCRLVASAYPVLRIWQVNQPDHAGANGVSLDEGADALLVRRDPDGTSIERLPIGDHAWLAALARGEALGMAIDAAQGADAAFDLGSALRTHIAAGTISAVVTA